MIISRYIQRNIYLGTFAALMVLVSLSAFFQFVRELDEVGQGSYDFAAVIWYVLLRVPDYSVELLPLATLLGSILSLGALASNSEFIAMQASGISLRRMLVAVLQAGLVMALLHFLLAEWMVPDSETHARGLKNRALDQTMTLGSEQGLWIKDESRVIHINALLPQGFARGVDIFQLDEQARLRSALRADKAVPGDTDWELYGVEQTSIDPVLSSSQTFEQVVYDGKLSLDVLRVLTISPRHMSSGDLRAYLQFIVDNKLDARVEKLVLWRKTFAPLTMVTMCLLAFPFMLGAQRQSNAGQRLLTGILLGLAFAVLDRLMIQVGTQFAIYPFLAAALPNLLFLGLAILLLRKKQSHVAGVGLLFRPQQ